MIATRHYCSLMLEVLVVFVNVLPARSSIWRSTQRVQQLRAGSRSFPGWTNETFPNPHGNDAALCRAGLQPHICDPDSLLSGIFIESQGDHLAQMAVGTGPPACPKSGYQVYVAMLRGLDDEYAARFVMIAEALETFARDWGRRANVLGGPCPNGVVIVYSGRDSALIATGDSGTLVPLQWVGRLTANEAIANAIAQVEVEMLKPTITTNVDWGLSEFRLQPTRIALTVVASSLGLAWVLLSLCCVYDTLLHWRHRHHWAVCAQKIKRVHNVFQNGKGEVHLCPVCVEWVPNDYVDNHLKKALVVSFLCGHRFHSECLQKWFRRNPSRQGRCPICNLPHLFSCDEGLKDDKAKLKSTEMVEMTENDNFSDACRSVNAVDEIKSFFLRSLKLQYPEIITDDNLGRWKSTHTEIWLSELECPRYVSIFKNWRK